MTVERKIDLCGPYLSRHFVYNQKSPNENGAIQTVDKGDAAGLAANPVLDDVNKANDAPLAISNPPKCTADAPAMNMIDLTCAYMFLFLLFLIVAVDDGVAASAAAVVVAILLLVVGCGGVAAVEGCEDFLLLLLLRLRDRRRRRQEVEDDDADDDDETDADETDAAEKLVVVLEEEGSLSRRIILFGFIMLTLAMVSSPSYLLLLSS